MNPSISQSFYPSIYLSLMLCFLWECPSRRWPWQKSLHHSLSKHSFFFSSSPHPLAPLLLLYPFTLSFHLLSALPLLLGPSISLTYIFINSSLFIFSIWLNYLIVSAKYSCKISRYEDLSVFTYLSICLSGCICIYVQCLQNVLPLPVRNTTFTGVRTIYVLNRMRAWGSWQRYLASLTGLSHPENIRVRLSVLQIVMGNAHVLSSLCWDVFFFTSQDGGHFS